MQPRLMRSRTETIIAGVCGGLGDYFGVDPVIVRLIFVLVTLTTGIGALVYPVLWIVMPKAAEAVPSMRPQPGVPQLDVHGQPFQASEQHAAYVMHDRASGQTSTASRVGLRPEEYNFDPMTGLPVERGPVSTGQTMSLGESQQQFGAPDPSYSAAPRAHRKSWWGWVFLGIGMLILVNIVGETLGVDLGDYVFPLLMIAGGVLLLRKR